MIQFYGNRAGSHFSNAVCPLVFSCRLAGLKGAVPRTFRACGGSLRGVAAALIACPPSFPGTAAAGRRSRPTAVVSSRISSCRISSCISSRISSCVRSCSRIISACVCIRPCALSFVRSLSSVAAGIHPSGCVHPFEHRASGLIEREIHRVRNRSVQLFKIHGIYGILHRIPDLIS